MRVNPFEPNLCRKSIDNVIEGSLLAFMDRIEEFFDSISASKSVNMYDTLLAQSNNAITCLSIGRRIPPFIEEDHVVGFRQRKALASNAT